MTLLIASVLSSAGCFNGLSTAVKKQPLDLCIADAYSSCKQLSPWNEESEVGTYLQRTVLLYKLCSLKHEVLIQCIDNQW